MNKVVHFEIPADDVSRAKNFYGDVFGWKMQGWGQEENFALVTTVPTGENGPTEPGAINGDIYKRNPITNTVNVVIDVESIEDHLEKVEHAGGKVLRGKEPVGDMGFTAYFTDTEGNVIGLWQTKK